jgi:hypothetical protein
MRIGSSIVVVVATVTALSEGKPTFAQQRVLIPSQGEIDASSIVPGEPPNEQKTAQPENEAPTAAPSTRRLRPQSESSVSPNEPRESERR